MTLTINHIHIDCIALDRLCLLRLDKITAICNNVNIVPSTIYTTTNTENTIYHHSVHESNSHLCIKCTIPHTFLPRELDIAIITPLPINPSNNSHTTSPPLSPPTYLLYLPYRTQTLLSSSSFPSGTTISYIHPILIQIPL